MPSTLLYKCQEVVGFSGLIMFKKSIEINYADPMNRKQVGQHAEMEAAEFLGAKVWFSAG